MEDFNYERQVTQETIADWIGLPRHQVENIIRRWGADKIVELLEIRGHYVSYEKVCEYIKFYEMG